MSSLNNRIISKRITSRCLDCPHMKDLGGFFNATCKILNPKNVIDSCKIPWEVAQKTTLSNCPLEED